MSYSTSVTPSTSTNSTPSEKIKDYRSLHKRFATIIDDIEKNAPRVGDEFATEGTYEEDSDSDPLYGSSLTNQQEIHILVREILQVQNDVKDLNQLLHSRRCPDRAEVARLTRQLGDLQDILKGQLIRAEALEEKYCND